MTIAELLILRKIHHLNFMTYDSYDAEQEKSLYEVEVERVWENSVTIVMRHLRLLNQWPQAKTNPYTYRRFAVSIITAIC
jgi:hypothetical protein